MFLQRLARLVLACVFAAMIGLIVYMVSQLMFPDRWAAVIGGATGAAAGTWFRQLGGPWNRNSFEARD
jgi:hypothetical protein